MKFHWIVAYYPGEEPLYEGDQDFVPHKGESLILPEWPRCAFPVSCIRYNLVANTVFIGVENAFELPD